jgi:DNA-binding response OmpR family regulator
MNCLQDRANLSGLISSYPGKKGGGGMAEKSVVLVVGSNRTNLDLLSKQLDREGYEIIKAATLDEFGETLKKNLPISLALIDVSGFDQTIWHYCEQLRLSKVPFIVISPQRSQTVQRDSLKHGASALLIKPLGVKDLLEFIHTLLCD